MVEAADSCQQNHLSLFSRNLFNKYQKVLKGKE